MQGNGTSLPPKELSALIIEVVSTTARIPSDKSEPIEYDDKVIAYPEVTVGKAGGLIMGLN